MSLGDWLKRSVGNYHEHTASRAEIAGWLRVADRDLASARTDPDMDWRFNKAYNAALVMARAALAASGYRLGQGEAHHYHTMASLQHTIGLDRDTVALLDAFRINRARATYDNTGVTSKQDAAEMIDLASEIRDKVVAWLRENRPDLLPE